jgi:hypothetical protein
MGHFKFCMSYLKKQCQAISVPRNFLSRALNHGLEAFLIFSTIGVSWKNFKKKFSVRNLATLVLNESYLPIPCPIP